MNVPEIQIPLFEAQQADRTPRKEPREPIVRHVEYCRFPRVCADQRLRLGFTRDVSASGLCLRSGRVEPVGALLRFTLRAVDGTPEREAIARVVWSAPVGDGTHRLGLEQIEASPRRPIRIRYLLRPPIDRVKAA